MLPLAQFFIAILATAVFALRGNRLLLLPDLAEPRDHKTSAHYEADTLPGSSGPRRAAGCGRSSPCIIRPF
jgi:hypothetical protein